MTTESIKKIRRTKPQCPFESYAHIGSPLSEDDRGGYLITFPDLPGCMSDGETEAEAIITGREAFESWMSARTDIGKSIPEPAYRPEVTPSVSDRFVTQLPKSVHAKLAERAKTERVSLNTLVLAYITEGLGRKGVRV